MNPWSPQLEAICEHAVKLNICHAVSSDTLVNYEMYTRSCHFALSFAFSFSVCICKWKKRFEKKWPNRGENRLFRLRNIVCSRNNLKNASRKMTWRVTACCALQPICLMVILLQLGQWSALNHVSARNFRIEWSNKPDTRENRNKKDTSLCEYQSVWVEIVFHSLFSLTNAAVAMALDMRTERETSEHEWTRDIHECNKKEGAREERKRFSSQRETRRDTSTRKRDMPFNRMSCTSIPLFALSRLQVRWPREMEETIERRQGHSTALAGGHRRS